MDVPPPETVALPSGPVEVVWRRIARARRISLRIAPSGKGVIVTLPARASRKAGLALLTGHHDWVAQRLAAMPPPLAFEDGALVPIGGVPHRIRHAPDAHGAAWLGGQELFVTGAPEFLRRRVTNFLKAEAGRRIAALVAEKAAAAEVVPRRITMKDTSSRWGSCAPDGSLAFSWLKTVESASEIKVSPALAPVPWVIVARLLTVPHCVLGDHAEVFDSPPSPPSALDSVLVPLAPTSAVSSSNENP